MEGRPGPDHLPRELFLGRRGRGHREDRAVPRVPLGCGQAAALPPRGGVSTVLGRSDPNCPPGCQVPGARSCCPGEWTENDGAARPPGSRRPMTLTGRGHVGSLLHLSSRVPGVTVSPASMFWRESPARLPGTCSMSKKRATVGLSCGCRRAWLLSKPLGPWTIG